MKVPFIIFLIALLVITFLWFFYRSPLASNILEKLNYPKLRDWDVEFLKDWQMTEWDTTSEDLTKVANFMNLQMHKKVENSNDVIENATQFIDSYQCRIGRSTPKTIPFGTDWRAHFVTMPLFLARYIWFCSNGTNQKNAAKLILQLIETPCKVLGRKLTATESIILAYPWIIAHYVLGTEKSARQHVDYQYAIQQAKFEPVTVGAGLYEDFGYLAKHKVVSYAGLYDVFRLASNLYRIESVLGKSQWILGKFQSIFVHPDNLYVGFNCVSYDSLDIPLREPLPKNFIPNLGLASIKSIGFIRYFTDKFVFSMRSQMENIAFYENDPNGDGEDTKQLAQWIDYRNIIKHGSFDPNDRMGMVFDRANKEAKLIKMPNSTLPFFPVQPHFNLTVYKEVIYLRHEYSIPQFGEYRRRETVSIFPDDEKITIEIEIIVNPDSQKQYELYFTKDEKFIASKYKPAHVIITHSKSGSTVELK